MQPIATDLSRRDVLSVRTLILRTVAWMTVLLGLWTGLGWWMGSPEWFASVLGAPIGAALGALAYFLAHFPGPSRRPVKG